ncbi:MAG: glycosyltransferase family 2 protein [Planctomycetota bacterium]
MPVSIVIPAHNEASVLPRCLDALQQGSSSDDLQIIVVANGCTDDTAELARRAGAEAIETDVPSKSNALNLGDAACSHFPRLYLDADCVIFGADVLRLAEELETSGRLVASPSMDVDLRGRSWSVYAFYDVWTSASYVRTNLVGSGAYMLSEAGRQRFESFPDLTADDAFIRRSFKLDERWLSASTSYRITPPKDLESLIRIKTRAHFGNLELSRLMPELQTNEVAGEQRQWTSLLRQALRPWRIPKLAVYAYVMMRAKREARRRNLAGKAVAWERDDSSRQPPAKPSTSSHVAAV